MSYRRIQFILWDPQNDGDVFRFTVVLPKFGPWLVFIHLKGSAKGRTGRRDVNNSLLVKQAQVPLIH